MRKAFIFGFAALAVMAFAVAPVFACGEETTSAKKASATSADQANSSYVCSASKSADATQASAKSGFCAATAADACADKMGMTKEECMALCQSGQLTMVNMNVQGMTCGGCETSLKAALEKTPGVVSVNKVCYKSGTASVYLDTRKAKSDAVLSAISNKGYTAEIIPAVATATTEVEAKPANSTTGATCTAAQKAACNASKNTNAKNIKAEGTK
jgi:copper chaperone